MEKDTLMSDFVRLIGDNYQALTQNLPRSAEAAEGVHSAFLTLLEQHIEAKKERMDQITRTILLWGAHSAWIDAAIAAASGHIASAFSNLRRALEFTCYTAKIKNSEQRANDWFNQRTDKEARKRFSGECSIPIAYEAEKYRPLRSLIVAYDICNYYGSHADLEAQALSLKDLTLKISEKKLLYNYQASVKDSLSVFVYVLLQGKRILTALMETMEDMIRDTTTFAKILGFVQDSVGKSISELNANEHPEWFKDVDLNETTVDDRFKELLADAKQIRKTVTDSEPSPVKKTP